MRRILVSLVLIAGVAAVGGCSGASRDPDIASAGTAAASASAQAGMSTAGAQAMTDYVDCMRDHGMSEADALRTAPPAGSTASPGFVHWKEARKACESHLLPEDPREKNVDAATLEKLRAFAVCMRAHDIEMTDPLPNGNMKINGRFEHGTRAQLEADPVYKAAMAACKDKLPAEESKK
jgi:hypothetical protein